MLWWAENEQLGVLENSIAGSGNIAEVHEVKSERGCELDPRMLRRGRNFPILLTHVSLNSIFQWLALQKVENLGFDN